MDTPVIIEDVQDVKDSIAIPLPQNHPASSSIAHTSNQQHIVKIPVLRFVMHSPEPARIHAREHLRQASLLFRHFKHRHREIAHPALKNLSILKTNPPPEALEESYLFVVVAIHTISTMFPEVDKRACRALEGMGLYRHEMIQIYETEEEDRGWDMIEDEIKEFEKDLKGGYEMIEVVDEDVV